MSEWGQVLDALRQGIRQAEALVTVKVAVEKLVSLESAVAEYERKLTAVQQQIADTEQAAHERDAQRLMDVDQELARKREELALVTASVESQSRRLAELNGKCNDVADRHERLVQAHQELRQKAGVA
jgi:chromosome segregation ATPase